MRLMTPALRAALPALYETDGEVTPKIVHAKFFTPWTDWTWYAIEYDGVDQCFGLVDGLELEMGYFTLSELESMRGPGGLTVERDLHFEPIELRLLKARLRGERASTRLPNPDLGRASR